MQSVVPCMCRASPSGVSSTSSRANLKSVCAFASTRWLCSGEMAVKPIRNRIRNSSIIREITEMSMIKSKILMLLLTIKIVSNNKIVGIIPVVELVRPEFGVSTQYIYTFNTEFVCGNKQNLTD